MRVGIIDCGTNTIRLLIADGDGAAGLVDIVRELRFARLGQGVDATGRFNAEAMERSFSIVEDYGRMMGYAGVDLIRFVATSAARDA